MITLTSILERVRWMKTLLTIGKIPYPQFLSLHFLKDLFNFYINNLSLETSASSPKLMHIKDQYLVSMMCSEHLKRQKTKHTREAACCGRKLATVANSRAECPSHLCHLLPVKFGQGLSFLWICFLSWKGWKIIPISKCFV